MDHRQSETQKNCKKLHMFYFKLIKDWNYSLLLASQGIFTTFSSNLKGVSKLEDLFVTIK